MAKDRVGSRETPVVVGSRRSRTRGSRTGRTPRVCESASSIILWLARVLNAFGKAAIASTSLPQNVSRAKYFQQNGKFATRPEIFGWPQSFALGILFGPLKPLVGVVIFVLIVLWFLDYI